MIDTANMGKQDPAEAVRRAFRKSGMSIKRLSESSRTPYSGVHRFLNVDADVRTSTLTRLAKALGLELVVRRKRKG